MVLSLSSTVTLNNGVKMPLLGLGTWETPDGEVAEMAVLQALKAGYRHIDTAAIYGNEASVGRALQKSGLPRKEIFVTTKLWNDDHTDPAAALERSLRKLRLDYVDLYLIHWPVPQRNASWSSFEGFLKDGTCRAIGVSNFTVSHLKKLLQSAKVMPAVNQVEFSPFLYQKGLLEFCLSKKIHLEAYSPLTRTKKFRHPLLVELAETHGKSPAQVLIRWCLQHRVVVIPKSQNFQRIKENADVFDFEIAPKDMERLDGCNEDFRTCWNPEEMA